MAGIDWHNGSTHLGKPINVTIFNVIFLNKSIVEPRHLPWQASLHSRSEKLQSTIGDAIRTVIPQFGQRLSKQTAPFIGALLGYYLIEHNGPVKK
jgi:hypothetical protein